MLDMIFFFHFDGTEQEGKGALASDEEKPRVCLGAME